MMSEFYKNLQRYLEAERLLSDFFSAFDFCRPECIRIAREAAGDRPVAGCCRDKFHMLFDLEHPAFELLRRERETLYGRPQDHSFPHPVSPCEYHNPEKGCLLTTHKSPVCIAFLCRKGIYRLRERYQIFTYDYLGVYYALEWILTGDLQEHTYREFKAGLLEMLRRVQQPLSIGTPASGSRSA
jgi:hypothetical protein